MNTVMLTGKFRKIWHEEGKSFLFKVSVRRNYKNQEGKYDWDNINVNCPGFKNATINFLRDYVNDGDIVCVQAHVHTYTSEKNGGTEYHQDLVCDQISIAARNPETAVSEERIEAPDNANYDEGFTEAGIDDEDCPF